MPYAVSEEMQPPSAESADYLATDPVWRHIDRAMARHGPSGRWARQFTGQESGSLAADVGTKIIRARALGDLLYRCLDQTLQTLDSGRHSECQHRIGPAERLVAPGRLSDLRGFGHHVANVVRDLISLAQALAERVPARLVVTRRTRPRRSRSRE